MSISRIAGQMLQATLIRDGNNLSFVDTANTSPTLYLDIANTQVGINTDSPTVALQVNGNIIANNISAIGNIAGEYVLGNGSQLTATRIEVSNWNIGNIISNSISNVQFLRFNANSGITVSDIGNNAALVTLGSSFKTWEVAGQANLVAVGEDVVEFVAGNGIIITTNAVSYPQQIKFTVGGNIYGNLVSVTGNITAGNINSLEDMSALGNIIGANIVTSGNISGVNVISANAISILGNVIGGNLITDGQVSALGNITGGNLITGGNVLANGSISATSTITSAANIIGGNILTGGVVSASANITGGNLFTSGLISAGANIQAPGIFNNYAGITIDSGYPGYINFYTGGTTKVTIDDSGNINGGVVSMTGNITGGNLTTVGNITGNNIFGNTISVGTILSNTTNGNIVISATAPGLTEISGTSGMVIPYGNNAERPSPAVEGTLRYNTEGSALEIYDGIAWQAVGKDEYAISSQTITPDGTSSTFTLDQATDAERILVSINGVGQIPLTNYTVAGTQLTMNETPQVTDIIEIRFISPTASYGAVNSGVQYDLAYYAETGATVSDTGANLTWNGANLNVNGNVTVNNILTFANLAMSGNTPPVNATDTTIAFKIPITINGTVYYLALTAAE
jgi:hypothetical protein